MAVGQSAGVVGREAELDRVLAFLEAGHARMLLEGEPGIGKTTLWQAGLDSAAARGFRVLESGPAAAERGLSFAALSDLLAELRDDIGGLPDPQRRALRIALLLEDAAGDPPEQRAIATALTELLRRTSRDAPTLIAIDDAHWLDAPSAAALEFAIRRLGDEHVGLFATSRPTTDLRLGFSDAERITVGPLSPDELDALIRERLGARLLRPVLRQLAETSGGSPFYALELAASLLRSGEKLEPGERLSIPIHLRDVVQSRLNELTPPAREAALATAALARPTFAAVQAVIREGEPGIAEAVASGILERDRQTIRFTHPLFAASVYEGARPADRKGMHKRLAEVVTDAEERARQLAEAADGPDATIATFVEAAAASAVARGAPDTGVRLAKLAVELTPPSRANALHKRRLDCARFAFAAGDPVHAEALLERHLAQAVPGRERAEVELELGRAALATRGASAATGHYERALHEVEGSDELELQALILTELADTHLADLRMDSDASERAVALAEKVWNTELLARALGVHAATMGWRDQPPSQEYWQRALEVERSTGQRRWAGPAYAYALSLMFRLDYDEATWCFHEVADSMRRRGDPMLQGVLLLLGDITRNAGRWDEAAAYVEEAHDVVIQTGRQAVEPECLTAKARLAMLRGDLEVARRLGDEALAALERVTSSGERRAALDGPMIKGLVTSIFARAAAMSGDHARAHELFVEQYEHYRSIGLVEWLVETLADDVTSLAALGELKQASRALDRLHEASASVANELHHGAAALEARAQGAVATARGDLETAIACLEGSRDELDSLPGPWPYEVARTLLALGVVQRRARQKAGARTTLERALEIFEQLGARLWAEKARAELAQISGRPSQPSALTATETRVAEVVAAGHSNAEAARELFMSPKTVEWNLSKIYKKLHVHSRAELAAKLARRPSSRQS